MSSQRPRFYKRPIFFVPVIIVAIPALWLAWWLGSPLFIDKTVDEAPLAGIPTATTATPSGSQTTTTAPPPTSSVAAIGEPAAAPATGPAPTTAAVATTTEAPEPEVTTTAAPEATLLFSGMFKDADARHQGSGDAAIYELADGTVVLRVENLDVTNGPDLHVFLAPVAEVTEQEQVMAEGYLDLGELKGNKGNQNYVILGNFDRERDWTVVIYCVPFHVVFSTAPLT